MNRWALPKNGKVSMLSQLLTICNLNLDKLLYAVAEGGWPN